MRIRFTSVVWEDVAKTVTSALNPLADEVGARLKDRDYGADVEEFLGVLIAVDDDDNQRWAKPYNRVGYVTDVFGKRFRQLSISVAMPWSDLTGKSVDAISDLFAAGLSHRLESRPSRLPKAFRWVDFSLDLTVALAGSRRASTAHGSKKREKAP